MFAVIVNPISGLGRGKKLVKAIAALLREKKHVYRVYTTQCAGDGAQQARQALSDGCTAVVCVGGDGTLSEVVSTMANSGVPLYIVPGGTGNDFARALCLPKDPIQALRVQMEGEPARMDCGSINGKAFINVSGSGFDVDVLRKTEELKADYPGEKAYRKAVAQALCRYRAMETEITIDDEAPVHERVTIAEVANGRYIGGGMCVAPWAKPDDGLFDVVIVRGVPRIFIPLLLPLFILGIHVLIPLLVRVVRARRVVMRAENLVLNIDGRLEEVHEAQFEMMPGALMMMRPVAGAAKSRAA